MSSLRRTIDIGRSAEAGSRARPPVRLAQLILVEMEPTRLNANHCAQLPGGAMSLNEAE
jgi:hypothetical protein